MKDRTIKKSQISISQNIEIYPCDNGFRIIAGCKHFVCSDSQFIPVMRAYREGEYEKALKILGITVVVEEMYKTGEVDYMNSGSGLKALNAINRAIDIAEENAKPKRGKKRGRPRKVKV